MRGKVVIITGGSSGIGATTAVHFASQGCLLALTARSVEGLTKTKQACIQAGSKDEEVLLIPADLQVQDNLPTIVEKTVEVFGKIDVLVNNAGFAIRDKLENVTVEDYDKVMNVNLKSVFFLTQSAMPHLIEAKGCVVNVSSLAGQRPFPDSIVYCLSKAALDHFTRTLALDVAAKNVRVNTVNPGGVDTPFFENNGVTVDVAAVGRVFHAMERMGTAEEMAKTIAFLADNEQSSFITGVTLVADGGAALKGPL